MYVWLMEVQALIPAAYSLKDKRRVVQSLIQRVKQKYNVSIAEVEDMDLYNKTTLGLALVINDYRLGRSVMDKIGRYMEANFDIEILDIQIYEV